MFNNGSNGYSLADIAAATNGNGGMWGGEGGAWWIIILFLFCFAGWGGNNGGGLFGGNNSTGSGITDGYILTSDFASLERQLDNATDGLRQQGVQIANGISSLGYDQLAQMNAINTNIGNSTNAINQAINNDVIANMQNTNSIGAQITALGNQLASCCCDSRYQSATQSADLNYRLAEQSCQTRQTVNDAASAITLNQDANTRSILSAIQDMQTQALQDKISSLTADNTALKFAASQQAQNSYLIHSLNPSPIPAYTVPSPYAHYPVCGGCGC